MKDKLEKKILNSCDLKKLEEVRVEIFGKKGYLAVEFAKIKDIPNKAKKDFAKNLNILKATLNKTFEIKKEELYLKHLEESLKKNAVDVSAFTSLDNCGALHPVMNTMDKIIDYFVSLNFEVEEDRYIEDDFHNFEALNLPIYHPAREMQDTFFLGEGKLLRTHTSSVQIRYMEDKNNKPPFKMLSPGAVFRKDFDLTHTPMFHQVEGLVVGKKGKVNFANLKFVLENFLKYMFGDVEVRFRPSFFPFTEPSTEVDISCIFCKRKGCRVCSYTGWLEVLGAGMVDENVFKAVGYEDVSGYAFGLGIERFAMLIHTIGDLRSLFEGDIRLLEQFR
jgi:phenylalanyl-tRNA synthetase alpha chain